MKIKPVPVYLLTGFLGSGKTTLLRRLIDDAHAKGWNPAVLMNEIGDVNLDGLLVDAAIPMAEMLGGCICCTVRGDLGLELAQLAKEHDPDVIWIESTGVAQPMEIIDAVTDASLYARFELRGVVTVVDARHLLDRANIGAGKTYRLMQEQVRCASLVLLNKTDLVAESELARLKDLLEGWNPNARIVASVNAGLDLELVYGEDARFNSPETAKRQPDDHERHLHHHHSHVNVWTRYLNGPLDSRSFENFVQSLPEEVYRAKGIVSFKDTANRYLFQYAYRQSDFLPIRPQGNVQDVLVMIGEGFSQSELAAKLDELDPPN